MSNDTLKAALARLEESASDVTETTPRLRAMFYGPMGGGKTTLAAGIAKKLNHRGSKILYVDTSEGWESVRKFPGLAEVTMQIPFTTVDDLSILAEAVKYNAGKFADIGTVIIDEASTIYQSIVDSLWRRRYDETLATGTARQKEQLEPNPQWPDYYAALVQLRSAFNAFYRVPGLHVILLAHRAEITDRKSGAVLGFRPAFSEKAANALGKDMHLVGYLTAQENRAAASNDITYDRIVQVMPTAAVTAKSRVVGLDGVRYSVDDVVSILDQWMQAGGGLTSETDVVAPNELPADELGEEVHETEELDPANKPYVTSLPDLEPNLLPQEIE